ncbi:MAG: type 1 glutamine amidotransferase [Planctomycetota bacterium]
MRLHYLQHVPFEGAANIAVWAERRGLQVTRTRLHLGEPLPAKDAFDWLVVVGGPMNVDDDNLFDWLAPEKQFLRESIDRGAHVLGVCLGGQLISQVLGGQVMRNRQKEIGWYPVTLTDAAAESAVFCDFPKRFQAIHWHGDTFSIPPGAVWLASSEGCDNQAFQFGDRVVALQFHLDYSAESIDNMILHCGDELVPAPGIQTPEAIRAGYHHLPEVKLLLEQMLNHMASI